MLLPILAQFLPTSQNVPMLPDPPALQHYFLENPVPATLALLIAATLAFFLLNRAGKLKQAITAATLLAGAAAAVFILASLITTDRETITRQTAALIRHATRAETGPLAPLLASDVTLSFDGRPSGHTKDSILSNIDANLRPGAPYAVTDYAILDSQASIDGPNAARTQVHLRVVPEALGSPIFSWWRLNWRQDGSGQWAVVGIDSLEGVDSAPAFTR